MKRTVDMTNSASSASSGGYKEKLPPNWHRRIAAMLLLAGMVVFMLVMAKCVGRQAKKAVQTPGITMEVQKKIYKYASASDEKVKAEAAIMFPEWQAKEEVRKQYISFANKHYQEALSKIAKHYGVSKKDVLKIIVKGLGDSWDKK